MTLPAPARTPATPPAGACASAVASTSALRGRRLRAPRARLRAAALAWALVLGAAPLQAAPFAYITNQGSHDVSVIDLANGQPVATIPVDSGPAAVATSDATGAVFIGHPEAGSIAVIDMRQQALVQRLQTAGKGGGPMGLAVNPDGTRLLASDWARSQAWIFDVAAAPSGPLREVASIPVGRYPAGVAWSPDGRLAFVAERDDDRIAVIDVASGRVQSRIEVGSHPFALAVDPQRQRLIVLNVYSNDLSVVDLRSLQVTQTVPVGKAPYGAALSSDGRRLFVTNQQADSVSVLDAETLQPLRTLTGFGYPEGIAAHGADILVVNWMDDELSIVDAETGAERSRVATGQNSRGFGAFVGTPK